MSVVGKDLLPLSRLLLSAKDGDICHKVAFQFHKNKFVNCYY